MVNLIRVTQSKQNGEKTERNLIVGLDIGTSKVAAIVGELTSDGNIEIIGIGSTPSRGLKKGLW
jgi:cell division protein FtsA